MFSFVKGSGWGVTTLPNRFDWEMEGSKVGCRGRKRPNTI